MAALDTAASFAPSAPTPPTENTFWIEVKGSGTPECDGLYCPSTAGAGVVSESGTVSELGMWNGKMAWDRVDGKSARNPALSYSNSYSAWRIARLDGHLAYTIVNDDPLPTTTTPWDVYKMGTAPAPTIVIHPADPRPAANTFWIEVKGSGTPECDGLYCPSTAGAGVVSESGTVSELGMWNGKMAWDRVDGKSARNPALSYSNSYNSWRIARLDGHLAYTIVNDDPLPTTTTPWDVYKKGTAPAPTIVIHPTDPRPRVVFVLGGPGAGKGTQCELAKNQLGWAHLSAGDLLRAERKKGGETADLINGIIVAGGIVPSEITAGLLAAEMATVTATTGGMNFLIDGFPRNQENTDAWEAVVGAGASVKSMILFEAPLEKLEQRILGRAKFSGRKDDNIESLRKRFATYREETLPAVEKYGELGLLIKVDSSVSKPEVWAMMQTILAPYTVAADVTEALSERSEMVLGLRPYPPRVPK